MRGIRGSTFRAANSAVLLLLAATLGAAPATAQGATQDPCADAPDAEVFWQDDSWLENLAFAGDALYVTDAGDGRLLRFTNASAPDTVASAASVGGVAANGTVHFGAQGTTSGPWQVLRLGADGPEAVADVTRANGMAFDAAGNLYYSEEAWGVHRIPAGGHESEPWFEAHGANGLAVDDASGVLFVALTDDGRSAILRVPLDAPANAEEVAHLSFGALRVGVLGGPPIEPRTPSDPTKPLVPKGIDDLTLGHDGLLYVTAFVAGEILRVDPADGSACVLASGLLAPTSARFSRGFADRPGDLFVTTAGGRGLAAFADDSSGALIALDTNLVLPASPDPVEPAGAPRAVPSVPALLVALAAIVLARRRA